MLRISQACFRCTHLRPTVILPLQNSHGLLHHRLLSSVPTDGDPFASLPLSDRPVQYSKSKAYVQKVLDFSESTRPKYERFIILSSLAIFMLYFFAIREENDLDREMRKPLWERVPGLERQTLQVVIAHAKKTNNPNPAAEARLAELLVEEAAGLGASFAADHRAPVTPLKVAPVPVHIVVAGKPIA